MQGMVIERPQLISEVRQGLAESPIVCLLGSRQAGKSTLARLACTGLSNVHYFDLEAEMDRRRLELAPQAVLSKLTGTIVLDEVQRIPRLFELLRPLADRQPAPSRFLLLGSASPDLVKGVSESLAGRIRFVQVPGFSIDEVGAAAQDRLWLRGGLPRSFLADADQQSMRWRRDYIATFLERDVPLLGIQIPAETLRRFWATLAGMHGAVWNASEMARNIGVSDKTTRHYLDVLAGTFTVRILTPWFENLPKRQIKSPKVYIRDTGILHALLDIVDERTLQSSRIYGASWEGFALEQTLIAHGAEGAFYWSTQGDAELDLMLLRAGRRFGIEFKCTDAPGMTASINRVMIDLGLDHVWVVYPGSVTYPIADRVTALPLAMIPSIQFNTPER